ncbi:MAG: hypothetical protein A3A61_04140 [Candidatus Woykebacteria bacterium RIFCSPLOWO2_01_FULL_43_14]|uniref:Peptidase M16 n=1 Tax=Candidatus Woykebacteria bacterium RIFCSPLOWO2_01_FULL_43_14 TaxID=1802605 RepID=A0A1G1WYK7_9BACT|nr:MAG: hypothetical protein A3A61_04140 [Candidatus Woykebacteria bacterium RIFCSPLOWO2_01_FULL_43_14]
MFTKETLDNGLRVITAPMDGVKSATVMIMVGAGARYETWEVNGVAHFAEHMFFKGTSKRPSALDISTVIDGVGGDFNAFTSKEYTGYYVKAASNHTDLSLDVLSDMLLNSKFDPEEIERERGVILEEMRMYMDMPTRYISNVYDSLLFGDHPLGWDVVGHTESINSISQESFKNYLKTFYSPQNIVLGIAGDITSEKARGLGEKYLGSLDTRTDNRFVPYHSKQERPVVKIAYKDTEQAHFALGYRSYPLGHRNHYISAVLSNILGGTMSSRLFIELRERRGLGYYVRCSTDEYLDSGTIVVNAGVQKDKISEAIELTLKEFEKITRESVPEEELAKAKEYLKGKIVLELEDSKEVSALYLLQETLEKEIKTPFEIMDHVDLVTADQVQSVAKELFTKQNLNLAMIGPYKDDNKFQDILESSQ